MFTADTSTGSLRRAAGLSGPGARVHPAKRPAGQVLRAVAVCGLLAMGLPGTSSAQAIGTMQASARVVPASAAWTDLSEAGLAARAAVGAASDGPLIRRNGLVRSSAEIRAVGSRREVLVTLQHPYN